MTKQEQIFHEAYLKTITMAQQTLFVEGSCPDPEVYGASAILSVHIAQANTDDNHQVTREVGNAPFTMKVKVNDVLVRTITDIPACTDPYNPADYNWVGSVPVGRISLEGSDSTLPEPLDFRVHNIFDPITPPYATLIAIVDPGGLDTIVTAWFGLTTEYDRSVPIGTVNGFDPVTLTKRLKSQRGTNDPVEFLEPETTYHYKVVALNSAGQVESEDMTFTTPGYTSAPTIKSVQITDIS